MWESLRECEKVRESVRKFERVWESFLISSRIKQETAITQLDPRISGFRCLGSFSEGPERSRDAQETRGQPPRVSYRMISTFSQCGTLRGELDSSTLRVFGVFWMVVFEGWSLPRKSEKSVRIGKNQPSKGPIEGLVGGRRRENSKTWGVFRVCDMRIEMQLLFITFYYFLPLFQYNVTTFPLKTH